MSTADGAVPPACPACAGTGMGNRLESPDCEVCAGSGLVSQEQYVRLTIDSFTSPTPVGPAEPTVEEYPDLDADPLRAYLAVHRDIWDMPTLMERRPDIVNWIAARYRVDFDMVSNVVLVDKRTNQPEFFSTGDVRTVVEVVLEREVAVAEAAAQRWT